MKYNGKYVKASAPVAVGTLMMRIAAVLLCLVLFSLHLMSGLYAKYTSSGNGDDTARVAKFEVNVTGIPSAVSIDSKTTNNGTYEITVTNESEVAVEYDIIVTLGNQASGVSTVLKTGEIIHTGSTSERVTTYTGVANLAAGTNSATHNLTFVVDWAEFTKNINDDSHNVDLTFTVTIHVDQVD